MEITREVLKSAQRLPNGTYVILTGANLGDPVEQLHRARHLLEERLGVSSIASSLWASPPWGFTAENDFVNQVLLFQSDVLPLDMLKIIKSIEAEMGRQKKDTSGYQSRIIDLDILFLDQQLFEHDKLCIPHVLLHKRKFVCAPLAEVLPEFLHPKLALSMKALNASLEGKVNVIKPKK